MSRLRKKVWEENDEPERSVEIKTRKTSLLSTSELMKIDRDLVPIESNLIRRENHRINRTSVRFFIDQSTNKFVHHNEIFQCRSRPLSTRHQLPLSANLLYQVDEMVGLIVSPS